VLIMPRYAAPMSAVLSVIITAFITGALARFAVPGPDPMPIWLTVFIGLVGSLAGAGIVYAITGTDPAWMGIAGFLCAMALVMAYRRFVQKRPLWGPGAYRFPERGIGVDEYRERLTRAGIDPDTIGRQMAAALTPQQPAARAAARADREDPTENPAHYLQLLDELHDSGVLDENEYEAARTRLLERLRA
jgi:uncharacterized membrane protein YeaQ/YmgE (transglycosylase-associated protein family)